MPLTSAPNEVRIRATGEVVTEQAFRAMHPRTSFPRVLTTEIFHDFGADPVLEAPAPVVTQYQTAVRAGVVQDALGNWVQAWSVRDWSTEEINAFKAQAKASKIAAIYAHRDKLVDEGGYKISVPGKGDRWFASDPRSKVRQMGLQMMGASIPPGVVWRTLDGDKVTITAQIASLIFTAAAQQDMAIDAAAETHKAAVEASADPASYDFSAGWPVTFG